MCVNHYFHLLFNTYLYFNPANLDYNSTSMMVAVLANQQSACVNFAIIDDLKIERRERFGILIEPAFSNPGVSVGRVRQCIVTIIDDDCKYICDMFTVKLHCHVIFK